MNYVSYSAQYTSLRYVPLTLARPLRTGAEVINLSSSIYFGNINIKSIKSINQEENYDLANTQATNLAFKYPK